MFRIGRLFGLLVVGVGLAMPVVAQDWTWGNLAIVSGTMGATPNRLCLGAADTNRPGDVGCPSYAPYVTSAGNVGIGTTAPSTTLDINGALSVRDNSNGMRFYNTADNNWTKIYTTETSGRADLRIDTGIYDALVVAHSGSVGIGGVAAPAATLQVSGSLIVSTTGQTTTPTLYVGTDGNVGIGTTSPAAKLDITQAAGATNYLLVGTGVSNQEILGIDSWGHANLYRNLNIDAS